MGLPVVTVATGGLPVVESGSNFGTPVTEATNGRGVAVTKVVGKPGLPVIFETIGAASAFASLDPATLVNTTLSNQNLTATHTTTANSGARALPAKSSGKYYFEITNVALGVAGDVIGLVTTAGTYGNVAIGTNCTGAFRSSGSISSNGSSSGKSIGAGSIGSITGIAVDLTARKAWLRRGAGNWNGLAIGSEDPAAGLGGVVVAPTVSFQPVVSFAAAGGGDIYTFNFGATAYANAAPSGFDNWPAT